MPLTSLLNNLKNILLVLVITLLVPITAKATTETWDPSHFTNVPWILSNGNLTATSPNTGPTQSSTASGNNNGACGSVPIPLGQKTYFEYKIGGTSAPWYYLQAAFGLGVGINNIPTLQTFDKTAEGQIIPSANATYIMYAYNRNISN